MDLEDIVKTLKDKYCIISPTCRIYSNHVEIVKFIEAESHCQGMWGGGNGGRSWSKGAKFYLCRVSKFWDLRHSVGPMMNNNLLYTQNFAKTTDLMLCVFTTTVKKSKTKQKNRASPFLEGMDHFIPLTVIKVSLVHTKQIKLCALNIHSLLYVKKKKIIIRQFLKQSTVLFMPEQVIFPIFQECWKNYI